MPRRLALAPLAVITVLLLAGCGPSAEEVAAARADDEDACVSAMNAFDDAQALIGDGIEASDASQMAAIASRLGSAAARAADDGEIQEIIQDAADATEQWAEDNMPTSGGGIPLSVDGPMYILEANCAPDEG